MSCTCSPTTHRAINVLYSIIPVIRAIINLLIFTVTEGKGDWSKDGCNLLDENGKYQDIVVCECDHLSTFGVFVVS